MAVQVVGVGHAMPLRSAAVVSVGLGVGMIDQLVPFQCSASVVSGVSVRPLVMIW